MKELVTSPSFSLINEYSGRLSVYHVDLYRVESPREADLLDLDAHLYGDGISVIEWAERAAGLLPPWTRRVSFRIHEDLTRTIVLDDSDDARAGETASRPGADA